MNYHKKESSSTSLSVRYFGIFTLLLGVGILARDFWEMVGDRMVSERQLMAHLVTRIAIFTTIPVALYVACFYVHLNLLYKAGPNDNIMTSAFQASLEVGWCSSSQATFVTKDNLYCLIALLFLFIFFYLIYM